MTDAALPGPWPPQPLPWAEARGWSRSGCERRSSHYCATSSARVLVAALGGSRVRFLSAQRGCQASPRGLYGPQDVEAANGWRGNPPAPHPCGASTRALGPDVQFPAFVFPESLASFSALSPSSSCSVPGSCLIRRAVSPLSWLRVKAQHCC